MSVYGFNWVIIKTYILYINTLKCVRGSYMLPRQVIHFSETLRITKDECYKRRIGLFMEGKTFRLFIILKSNSAQTN